MSCTRISRSEDVSGECEVSGEERVVGVSGKWRVESGECEVRGTEWAGANDAAL